MFRFTPLLFALFLAACATPSLPKAFVYDTSVRGEQGFVGTSDRAKAAASLLAAGVVTDPTAGLQAALPDAQILMRRWGVSYFPQDWTRYQVVMEADIRRDDAITKCRMGSPETPVGAMTLAQVRENDGAALQAVLKDLVAACVAEAL